ncbi:MAG: NAD(P)-dependent alcohol dehydrogenase [Nanoarchaeota archaeon]
MKVNAYAAPAAGKQLEAFSYEAKPLRAQDVEIKITHCGICHSDVHLIDNDWKISQYPLVPGHEIVGIVTEIGSEVKGLKKGDRVGVGWQSESCMKCEYCLKGEENLCPENKATCVNQYGGYAERIQLDYRFAFLIPANLDSEKVAPLLCGGITVYSPLKRWVKPSMKIGVIGLGGLGHLGVLFAKAMGCEVTVFSHTPEKEKEAKQMGAHQFVTHPEKESAGSYDFILNTSPGSIDLSNYMKIIKNSGVFCQVGAMSTPYNLRANDVLHNKIVCGSVIGSRKGIQEMLQFAAKHKIETVTEALPLSSVNEAILKVRENKVRYRMVLTI